jgi:hypothetical protein
MVSCLANLLARVVPLIGVALLMLVPSGMCICDNHEDEGSTDQHEPGCPKVRKLERPPMPEQYCGDSSVAAVEVPAATARPIFAPRRIEAVAHGPPRGRPIYLALQTLLI